MLFGDRERRGPRDDAGNVRRGQESGRTGPSGSPASPATREASDDGYILAVSLAPNDATGTLFFANLAGRFPLRMVPFPGSDVAAACAGARAVVVVRGLFEFGNLIATLQRLGIPTYYFVDDNFMLIREEPGIYGTLCREYSLERVRAVLSGFSGVLLATPALVDYFAEHQLSDRLALYPPVAGPLPDTAADQTGRPLSVAFFGGSHRRDPFLRYVYPAVRRLAAGRDVTLVVAGIEADLFQEAASLRVVSLPYNPSYADALREVAAHGIDILVHPSSETRNNAFKNPHVLINARALAAVPIFSNVAPYDAVAAEGVAILCENTEDAWFQALVQVASDRGSRAVLKTRLNAYCEQHFGGEVNLDVLRRIQQAHEAPGAAKRMTRLIAASASLNLDRAHRMLARRLHAPA
jgi:hypothetical protein